MSTAKRTRCGKRSLIAAFSVAVAMLASHIALGQDLAPRAYVITPVNTNAVNLTYSFYTGALDLNGAIPITDSTGTYNVPIFNYYRSLNVFGRSANISAALPYGVGTFQGQALGSARSVYRSGLLDPSFRFSMNLLGGPAMDLPEFGKWRQKTLLGASLRVLAPVGQYSSDAVINWGTNRWSFKPELGYSRRWNKWVLDGYAGVWLYTTNPAMIAYPRPAQPQSLSPVGSFEGHLSHDIKQRFWFSLDGNYWSGGTATLGGVTNLKTKQTSSRIGGTASFPVNQHQSIKVSYSRGAYVRYGGDYENVSVSWQYSWFGKPH